MGLAQGNGKPNPFMEEAKVQEAQQNVDLLDMGGDKSDDENDFPDDVFSDGGPNI